MKKNKPKNIYNLAYHLKKTKNLRMKGKIKRIIKILSERYGLKPVFTKRIIWFFQGEKKFIQIRVKEKLNIKIKKNSLWIEINLLDWECMRRLDSLINNT